jgi:hypothetical protein
LIIDLKREIKELGWSFDKINSQPTQFAPLKKRALDLYRDLVVNDPELAFTEKLYTTVFIN